MRLTLKRTAQRFARAIKPDINQPDWRPMLRSSGTEWREAIARARSGPRVLIATAVGGHPPSTTIESLLAVALTLRGANVEILLCDERLPACLRSHITGVSSDEDFVRDGPQASACIGCYGSGKSMYESLGLPIRTIGQMLSRADSDRARQLALDIPRHAIPEFQLDGLAVGEHALAGALRFYARGTLDGAASEGVLRRYFEAALMSLFGTRRLMNEGRFDAACFSHGIYVPHGIIGEVARQQGVRVINWNPAYRKQSFIFSHHDTYHHTLMDEPTAEWEGVPWTGEREREVMEYLRSRWNGSQDWITFNARPQESPDAIADSLGIDFSKPTIGLLTNVVWDAQLHYRANAFSNMMDWLTRTIEYFIRRRDLQLLIRVHPAEKTGAVPSRQPVIDEITKHFPELPRNVYVIPPESAISTYVAMSQCNAAVIYGTKTGVELTSLGIPVIVAGEAWIRNKGLTWDPRTPSEYFDMLDRLPLSARMPTDVVARARKYAYHFFFRRMIPIRGVRPATGLRARSMKYELHVRTLDELRPGQDAGLDVICDGILDGAPFVYRAELNPEGRAAH